jgi:glycosidase
VLDFFAIDKSKPSQFDAALGEIRSDYPDPATAVIFNLLDSHDVERIRTMCRGEWPRERQAIAFQMSYPGTPVIYYGDEVGMEGGKDPDNRRAMPWNPSQWDKTTLAFYKSAIAMRKQHPVLRRGDYQTLITDDKAEVYAFSRNYQEERAIVAFNRSDTDQKAVIPIPKIGSKPFATWLDGGASVAKQGDNLVISLPKRAFAVLGR